MNLMTVTEFGKRLGVGRASAYRLVAKRRVAVIDVGTGARPRLRVSEQAFKDFVDANQWKVPVTRDLLDRLPV